MSIGTVKSFNPQQRYGFIRPADGSRDVFVHVSALERAGMTTLKVGQRVQYEMTFDDGEQSMTIVGLVA